MRNLYLDLEYGISGDMFLAALADLGVDYSQLQDAMNRAGLGVDIEFSIEKRNSIAGKKARFSWDGNQPFRHLQDILALVDKLDLSLETKKRSSQAFARLAQVEAQVHDQEIQKVHFHEIGALDTLIDVVGACWGLEQLEIHKVCASPVPWFRGKVSTAHGELPLPAPATAILLHNKKVRPSGYDWEVVTPTGALILDQLVQDFETGFEGTLLGMGLGFGESQRNFNGLRLFLSREQGEGDQFQRDQVWVLTTNVDHLTGEELGIFLEKAMQSGALDVIHLPGTMKKNRPGSQIQVMCRQKDLARIQEMFFQHTLTLGIRVEKVSRVLLPRKNAEIEWGKEKVQAKEIIYKDKSYLRPEMNALLDLAEKKETSVVELRLARNKDPK